MFSLFFTQEPAVNYRTASKTDSKLYAKIFHQLLAEKIFAVPSNFEAWFLSTEHGQKEIDKTLEAFSKAVFE